VSALPLARQSPAGTGGEVLVSDGSKSALKADSTAG